LAEEIRKAIDFFNQTSSDLDMIVVDHNNWGKGEQSLLKVNDPVKKRLI
jgi:hypothetical protein